MAKKSVKASKPSASAAAAKPSPAAKPADIPKSSAPALTAPAAPAPRPVAPPAPAATSPSPTAPKMLEKPAPPQTAPAPTGPRTVLTAFVLEASDAQKVSVAGEFNGWKPDKAPMKRNKGGQWETVIPLALGRHQYKFVVDGQWVHDPKAMENVPNEVGSLNSVVVVRG